VRHLITILTVIALMCAILPSAANARPEMLWAKVYGDVFTEIPNSIIPSGDGGAIIAGAKWRGAESDYDILLMKVDAAGDSVWSYLYSGQGNQWAEDIVSTPDGGYLVAGSTWFNGNDDGLVVKFDCDGLPEWETQVGGDFPNMYYYYKILNAPDDCYYLVGTAILVVEDDGCMNMDCIVTKMTPEGQVVWTNYYGVPEANECCYEAIQTSDGGIALTGYSWLPREDDWNDALLMKLSPEGELEWMREYGDTLLTEDGFGLAQTPDGGYIIVGEQTEYDASQFIARTDENGELLWTKAFIGPEGVLSYAWWVVNTPNEGYLVGGFSSEEGSGDYDFNLKSLDVNGEIIWTAAYGGALSDRCYAMLPTEDGGMMLVGETRSYGNAQGMSPDLWLIKVAEPDKVAPEAVETTTSGLSLSPAYPNPFNSTTVVSFQTSSTENVYANLVDESGREWTKWSLNQTKPGSGRFVLDGASLPTGVYWLKVSQNNKSVQQRIVLVR